jgi:hypothetical protein
MTRAEYEEAAWTVRSMRSLAGRRYQIELPPPEALDRGGIVGSVEIVNCVRHSMSEWKNPNQWGFLLRDSAPLPFRPCKGMLGFFEVPDA